MNPISSLAKEIQVRFPRWRFTEDIAEQSDGSSFLDIECEGRTAIVEWRPGKGFGISSGPVEGYGTGPDEVHATAESALERLADVLERAHR